MINWEKVNVPKGTNVNCIIAKFEIEGYRRIENLSIEIRDNDYTKDSYTGICSYHFWGPEQASPYISLRGGSSIEEAFNDALCGITEFDRNEFDNKYVFFVKYIGDNEEIYDGNGIKISKEEANKRREEYRNNKHLTHIRPGASSSF